MVPLMKLVLISLAWFAFQPKYFFFYSSFSDDNESIVWIQITLHSHSQLLTSDLWPINSNWKPKAEKNKTIKKKTNELFLVQSKKQCRQRFHSSKPYPTHWNGTSISLTNSLGVKSNNANLYYCVLKTSKADASTKMTRKYISTKRWRFMRIVLAPKMRCAINLIFYHCPSKWM